MLTWAAPFSICCFLDSQGYPSDSSFECVLAVGAVDRCRASAGSAFASLKTWAAGRRDWLFGHFGYELATETEGVALQRGSGPGVASGGAGAHGFPDLFFFVPETVVMVEKGQVRTGSLNADPKAILEAILGTDPGQMRPLVPPVFTPRFTKDEYLSTVRALQRHILRGDCYEINFCMEFFAQHANTDPLSLWWALSRSSPNPFSAFYRLEGDFLCCASPERFLKKKGDTFISQPIKGTAARIPGDGVADRLQSETLYRSMKDRAENVMVVDLVRNDLSKICLPGSVRVAELFGIYAFPQVYQMISTITGEGRPGVDWTEAVRATFPMGSMTGAPKNSVIRLIDRYERSRRGLFSGAVGYVDPKGDFDFNVVIRSLFGNSERQNLSYQVGSGITFYSDAVAEYEECLVKAEGIRKALS